LQGKRHHEPRLVRRRHRHSADRCYDFCDHKDHPLIKLANALPWALLIAMVIPDLKRTTAKGFWWTGRRLLVRVHLAAYILQKLYDLTDRQVEYGLKDNAAHQLFAGKAIIAGWRSPDHTKVEEFRSRLSPETQRLLANEIAKVAVGLGFADPSELDIDSTVQEANIAYPSDAILMTKLAGLGRKVVDFLRTKTSGFLPADLTVDMKAMKAKARAYFFMAKNTAIERRRKVFKDLHRLVKQQMRPIVEVCARLDSRHLACLPWNIRRAIDQINSYGWRYLLDVGQFTRTHTIKAGKVLAFHAQAVACIRKGKVGKENEFGRVFQLGRIKGNFLCVLSSTSLRMDDKRSLISMVEEHAALFGQERLKSAAADKGYWRADNQQALTSRGIVSGLQPPRTVKSKLGAPSPEVQERLRNRRAGIEALISHTKHGGQLGKSRMKSDAASLAAGYASVFGFNLRQLIRRQRDISLEAA
jgi:IS5 family transposase